MRPLMITLAIFSCAVTAQGKVFQMDRRGDAVVEVEKSGGEYKVKCRFKPQMKFDKAINAKLNDAKGDTLCKKGLARYLNVGADETLAVAGLYSAAPVETAGERWCYSFGVPVSGCRVLKTRARPKQPAVPGKPDVKPEQPAATEKPAVAEAKPAKTAANSAAKPSSFLCVAKYREVNGKRTAISRKEYQRCNFKSPKEFERFCQQEFARIRAQGDANLRAVRNFGK